MNRPAGFVGNIYNRGRNQSNKVKEFTTSEVVDLFCSSFSEMSEDFKKQVI